MDSYVYLAHHGTKGMKWGQRKYQNSDGSLTPLGRAHYGIGAARKAAGAVKEAVRKKVAPTNAELNAQIRKQRSKNLNKEKRSELKSLKKGIDPKQKDKNEATGTHKKFTEMNDKEIQDRINRLQKEIQLEELEFRTSLTPGKRFFYDVGKDALKQGLTEVAKSVVTDKGKKLFGVSGNNNNNDGKKDENKEGKKDKGKNPKDTPTDNTVRYRRQLEEMKARDALQREKKEEKEKKKSEREEKKKEREEKRRSINVGTLKD